MPISYGMGVSTTNGSYPTLGYHRLAVNLIPEILLAWFIIDSAHFEIHPRARQKRESYVTRKGLT